MTINASTALITGGTSGIGRSAADKLAQLGIHVLVVGRSRGSAILVVMGLVGMTLATDRAEWIRMKDAAIQEQASMRDRPRQKQVDPFPVAVR